MSITLCIWIRQNTKMATSTTHFLSYILSSIFKSSIQRINYIYLVYLQIYFSGLEKKSFLRVCSVSLLKTLWKKEKFSFSHSVFYPLQKKKKSGIFSNFEIVVLKLIHFGRVYNLSFGKGLSPLLNILAYRVETGFDERWTVFEGWEMSGYIITDS